MATSHDTPDDGTNEPNALHKAAGLMVKASDALAQKTAAILAALDDLPLRRPASRRPLVIDVTDYTIEKT